MSAFSFAIVSSWLSLDTWIVLTAAAAAMACALPGTYLVLRRQSLMGDAISHTVLLGVVVAFVLAHHLADAGWVSGETSTRHVIMFAGAMVIGVLSAVLAELIQRLGRVESSAALGVVFTSMFALGLVLVRMIADDVHIDPDCVLFGILETSVMEPAEGIRLPGPLLRLMQSAGLLDAGDAGLIPQAAVVNTGMLLANLGLLLLFYKELRISTFDPEMATTQGIGARWMHYGLMAVTAMTLVAAFETVGSILVIAMLIVPAATARLLTDRLGWMLSLSVLLAAVAVLLGHVLAITLPPLVFGSPDYDVNTGGMIAVACGMLFVLAAVFGPRYGVVSKLFHSVRLTWKIACEDLLGFLFRLEESGKSLDRRDTLKLAADMLGMGTIGRRMALWRLRWMGRIQAVGSGGYRLTGAGRDAARSLVRAHRLWESYMSHHFDLPDDHLHETASRVEHYIDPALQQQLAEELQTPPTDPHGRAIPPDGPA